MAIETNNNLLKLNQTSGTSSTGSTQTTPYMSATDKALNSGASVFDIAKSQASSDSNNSDNKKVSAESTKSQTAKAESQTTVAENASQQLKENKAGTEALASKVSQESKSAVAQIKSNQAKNKELTAQQSTTENEISALQAEVDSLSENGNSNPFGGSSADAPKSIYSLSFESSQPNQQSGGLLSSPTKTQGKNESENPNQAKIADLNGKIDAKTNTSAKIATNINKTATTIKTLFKTNTNRLLLANNKFINNQTKAKAASNQADALTKNAQITQTIGATATATGTIMAAIPPTAAAGHVLINVGTGATAAGSALSAVSSAEKGDALGALTSATSSMNSITTLSKQNKETQNSKTA